MVPIKGEIFASMSLNRVVVECFPVGEPGAANFCFRFSLPPPHTASSISKVQVPGVGDRLCEEKVYLLWCLIGCEAGSGGESKRDASQTEANCAKLFASSCKYQDSRVY